MIRSSIAIGRRAASSCGLWSVCASSLPPYQLFLARQQPYLHRSIVHFFSTTDDPSYSHRHSGIDVNPHSISSYIMPGNFVIKTTRNGAEKKRYTELVYGYFWMIKDLRKCDEKPILSNTELIPSSSAKPFPPLEGLKSLSGDKVNLPAFFLRKNRSLDAGAQCTIVAVSFRDYGYQLLSSWLDPVRDELGDSDRVEIIRLNLSEGWLNKWILRGVIQGLMIKNTPKEEHDTTLIYFGTKELEGLRDALRMHNLLTGFVFLLDGLGRVRFAGSGPAAKEEVERLVGFAKELTPQTQTRPMRGRSPSKSRSLRK